MRRLALAGVVAALLVSGCGSSVKTEDYSHACAEDSWCWQPLTDGNHLGAVLPMEVTR